MKKIITAILLSVLALPSLCMAWSGKIVAVESADTFIVLKNGKTPEKVKLAGVTPPENMDKSKARLGSSNVALMKDVDVHEISRADGIVVGDITLNGSSLAKELLDEGVVQRVAAEAPAPPPEPEFSTASEEMKQAEIIPEIQEQNTPSTKDIITDLDDAPVTSTLPQQSAPAASQARAVAPMAQQPPAPLVRYVQVNQDSGLGFWPARPKMIAVPAAQPMYSQSTAMTAQPVEVASSSDLNQPAKDQESQMQTPGDIAKKDYELAVRVQKKARYQHKTGFITPKKKSETFIGISDGLQLTLQPKSNVPYENWGGQGGLTVRHFFPSGLGIGGDLTYFSNLGRSGSKSTNSTSSTDYDYKNDFFNTYSLTAALLYRFYTGKNISAYIGAHGGYSLFSFPNTEFHLSDGAPALGASTGLLYKFGNGFTIGGDLRYLEHIGTKSDDPDGYFGTTFNIGYTFN